MASPHTTTEAFDPMEEVNVKETPLLNPNALESSEMQPISRLDAEEYRHENFLCKRILCCCVPRAQYLRCRRGTWDTLSRHASKFGRPARFGPSKIFEAISVTLILANVAYASVYLQAFETGNITADVYRPGANDPFHNFTDIVDGTAGVWVLDVLSLCFFSCEYFFRLWASVEARKYRAKAPRVRCAGERCRWCAKPLSILDLALLPVFAGAVVTLCAQGYYYSWLAELRVIVFFRLERQVKALGRLKRVLGSKSEEILIAFFFTLVCVLYGAVAIYFVEQAFVSEGETNEFPTFATALWWSSCIVSGNGYGDHIPQSWPGKVIAALVGLLGVLTVALPSGIIGATFVEIMANSNRDTALSSFFSKGGAQDVAGAPMGFGASSTTLNGIAPKKRRNFGDVSKSQRNSRLRHRQSVSSTLSEVDSYTYLPDAIRSRRGSSISTASLPAHANDPYAQTYRNQRLRGTSNVHRARPRRGSNQSTSAGPVVARRSSGGSTTAESPTSAAAADPAGSNAGNSPSSPQTTEAANAPNPLVAGVFQENQELRDRVAALEKKLADLVLSQRPAPLLPSAAAAATSSHEGSEALRCPVCASMLEVALKSQENPQPSPTR